jgi:hypothetical protein
MSLFILQKCSTWLQKVQILFVATILCILLINFFSWTYGLLAKSRLTATSILRFGFKRFYAAASVLMMLFFREKELAVQQKPFC